MPDLLPLCNILMRWRQRSSRILFEVPAHLRQHIPDIRPPLEYPDEPVVLRSYDDSPQAQVEREARNARWPIFDPPYAVTNWEGDIEPLPGYDAWMQEQAEARARWEEEFPPHNVIEEDYSSEDEEDELYNYEEEEEVEQPLVLLYPDEEEEEDRDFFVNEIF